MRKWKPNITCAVTAGAGAGHILEMLVFIAIQTATTLGGFIPQEVLYIEGKA